MKNENKFKIFFWKYPINYGQDSKIDWMNQLYHGGKKTKDVIILPLQWKFLKSNSIWVKGNQEFLYYFYNFL